MKNKMEIKCESTTGAAIVPQTDIANALVEGAGTDAPTEFEFTGKIRVTKEQAELLHLRKKRLCIALLYTD